MPAVEESADHLLQAAYSGLDFTAGELLEATDVPGALSAEDWINKGGWLSLAKKLGAERLFFVGENPVVVFARVQDPKADWHILYNQIWCMARPPLLFLAQPGELTVLDLTHPPIRRDADADTIRQRVCNSVTTSQEVQIKLQKYHRAAIESGQLFGDHRFGSENRADRALIRDLGKVRGALLGTQLSVRHAHALIGRSIFVRYLEDRGVLVENYYRRVAGKMRAWHELLDAAPRPTSSNRDYRLYYTAVLKDTSFTHALFQQLALDFNGDLFPFDEDERQAFTEPRLDLVRRFLLGEIEDQSLFFFAYDFQVIPIELISSMYEEFLKIEKGKENTQGSFYTPPALVEFVLSQVLTAKVMDRHPRIVDAACGSAIFLVEAFRRLVRHRSFELRRRMRSTELRKMLREQIAGIDVNPEAIRVAAFSLYLALLHYLDPPDIIQHKLPNLTYKEWVEADPLQHFDILLPINAFVIEDEVKDNEVRRRFGEGTADVIVGNPPWGDPKDQDPETRKAAEKVSEWCDAKGRSIGDKELSQAFIHLTMYLLSKGGIAGLLVSTGVFFKRHPNSRLFRKQWFNGVSLQRIVNFAAVRQVFFTGGGHVKGAIAPFASVLFSANGPRSDHRFEYFSAKQTGFVDQLQIVAMKKADLHLVRQAEFVADEELWKVFWWGGHRDKALLQALRLEKTLIDIVDPTGTHPERLGIGFQESAKNQKPTSELHRFKEFPTKFLTRYGPLPTERLIEPPKGVERERDPIIYDGCRLLIKRGITQKGGANGQILVRLEHEPFCFRHSIYGVRLIDAAEEHAEILLGILWSSLTRYFVWLTAGSWGPWHHEILRETIRRVPVRIPENGRLRQRILRSVHALRDLDIRKPNLFSKGARPDFSNRARELARELDEAVFDLFELVPAERDLVRDMCDIGLPFFYQGMKSLAVKPIRLPADFCRIGTWADIPKEREKQNSLHGYIAAFLEIWEPQLPPEGQFRWEIIQPATYSPMIAIIFYTEDKQHPLDLREINAVETWEDVLEKLSNASRHKLGSRSVYVDGMTRRVSENEVLIIKQNELRLWTRTAAREDAEATILQAMEIQRKLATGVR